MLQLLVYTAAETGAQPFIEMIFQTSAGKVVFDSYKDISPLPEVIARNNGHEETAHYLEVVSSRYILGVVQYRKTTNLEFITFPTDGCLRKQKT